jgi:hypothetical protein
VSTTLPLFPLGTVLVPGELLPLHVFEPRYRTLVDDLLAARAQGATPAFGVIAIRQGLEVGRDRVRALHGIGCVAEVLEVQQEPDGSSDVLSVGRQRFRLVDLVEDGEGSEKPYLVGRVEWCEEPVTAVPPELVARVQQAFDRYCRGLGVLVSGSLDGGLVAHESLTGPARDDPTMLSYLVTGSMVLHLAERQRLLAAPDAGSRLRTALQLLRRELTLLEVVPSVPALDLAQVPADPR